MKWKCDNGSRKQNELLEKQKIKESFQHDQLERSEREDPFLCERCNDDVRIETTSWDKKTRRICKGCGDLSVEKCGRGAKECFALMCTCRYYESEQINRVESIEQNYEFK